MFKKFAKMHWINGTHLDKFSANTNTNILKYSKML